MSDDVKAAQAASFDRAADVYERARPSYPTEAVDWLLESRPQRALDLGAGTGKLTRTLVGRVPEVLAVDPSPNMLAELARALPGVETRVGTGERIPLPDDSLDAVYSAQAWHWVDPVLAEPEVARVLRPGGTLGLIWNTRDESVPWVARLTEIIQGSAAERFVADGSAATTSLGDVETFTTTWSRPFDRRGLLDLVASRSYMITAAPDVRERVLGEVGELLDTHPDLADREHWALPYRTEAFRVRVG